MVVSTPELADPAEVTVVPRVDPPRLRDRPPTPSAHASAPPWSSVTFCAGRRPRSPSSSRRARPRSTAPCNGPGPRSRPSPMRRLRHSTSRTRRCSSATWTHSSATTSSAWSPCCTTTPCSPCHPSPCGSAGRQDIAAFMVQPGPSACRGSRLLPTWANGCPAFGQYRRDPDGGFAPWALQVLEISGGSDPSHELLPRLPRTRSASSPPSASPCTSTTRSASPTSSSNSASRVSTSLRNGRSSWRRMATRSCASRSTASRSGGAVPPKVPTSRKVPSRIDGPDPAPAFPVGHHGVDGR